MWTFNSTRPAGLRRLAPVRALVPEIGAGHTHVTGI
jgi:hypothetical protein